MALSDREQQVLRDLEEQFEIDDPDFATTMAADPTTLRFSPRHVGVGMGMVLLALVVILFAVSLGHGITSVVVGVLGFGLAVWGVTLLTTRVDATGQKVSSSRGSRDGACDASGGQSRRAAFWERQEERWERRND